MSPPSRPDRPSPPTPKQAASLGWPTGSGLVLDGQDAALLRASVVDANGRVMHLATSPGDGSGVN